MGTGGQKSFGDVKFCLVFQRETLSVPVMRRVLVGGPVEFHLEPLSLPDPEHLPEPQTAARAGDGLALRIMYLGLEHDFHDHPVHVRYLLGHQGIYRLLRSALLHRGRVRPTGHAAYATTP